MSNIDTLFVLCQTGLQRRDRRSPCAARQAARLLGVNLGSRLSLPTGAERAPDIPAGFEVWSTLCGAKIVLLAGFDWLEASLVYGSIESIVAPA